MSSNNQNQRWSSPEEIPDSAITSSYGGMHNFMLSYGLKIWNPEDVEEAKAIINAFKQADYEASLEEAKSSESKK
jgi:hypothetical protein